MYPAVFGWLLRREEVAVFRVMLIVGLSSCATHGFSDAAVDGGNDGGRRDPGYDIPPELWIDGGNSQAGGCYGRNLDRFVVEMETTRTDDMWCAAMHFKRYDGGFERLFPEFQAPEGFAIYDARWSWGCTELYLANGELDTQYRPVHGLTGSLVLDGYYLGKPQLGHYGATIRLDNRVYYYSDGLIGFSPTCPGP